MMDIRDLSFDYKGKIVLDQIEFSIEKGEMLGILGPNGCGKTTLLGNLNRNLKPKIGCVLVEDKNLEDLKKKDIAKDIAVIPQTNEIRFSFTVREIVAMGRMPFQDSFAGESGKDLEIIQNAMDRVGISDFSERFINTMSGGERQRVIIARALAQTPKVLLMDEPTLHLDISAQFDVLNLIHDLSRRENLTVVIVSHDLPMVARYCDRVMLIHNHRIHALGKTEEVLTPENMRTVFNVEADLTKDPQTGRNIVTLFDSYKGS